MLCKDFIFEKFWNALKKHKIQRDIRSSSDLPEPNAGGRDCTLEFRNVNRNFDDLPCVSKQFLSLFSESKIIWKVHDCCWELFI